MTNDELIARAEAALRSNVFFDPLLAKLIAALKASEAQVKDRLDTAIIYRGIIDQLRTDAIKDKARVEELEQEVHQAWVDRNRFANMVRGWQETLVIDGTETWRSIMGREWGPSGEADVSIPQPSPQRLTEILDELREARAALKGD